MLLTSAQVSFAVSSVIVFFFTSALFISGYVLQQQTVRDLRAAIKPQLLRPPPGSELYLPPQFREDGYLVDSVVVEVNPSETQPEEGGEEGTEEENMVGATRWQKAARRKQMKEKESAVAEAQKPIVDTEENVPGIVGESQEISKDKKEEKSLSRAERRRRIKEQILAEGEGEGFKGYRRRMW